MAGADRRPAFSSAQTAFGVPATVTRPAPDDEPIETIVVWLPPIPNDAPAGFDLQRQDPKKVLSVPIADVPTVPRRTVIEAPEVRNGEIKRWRVDGFDRYEFDAVRVTVVPDDVEN